MLREIGFCEAGDRADPQRKAMNVKMYCLACTGIRTCPFCPRNLSGIHHTAIRTVNYKQHINLKGDNRMHALFCLHHFLKSGTLTKNNNNKRKKK